MHLPPTFPFSYPSPMSEANQGHLLAVAVGASRTRIGIFHGNDLSDPVSHPNADLPALTAAVLKAAEGEHGVSIVIAARNADVGNALQKAVEDAGEENVFRIGRDIEIPMTHSLDDAANITVDRLLSAYGAFTRAKQACVVVDVSDDIAVDFVDGEGVYHGGVTAPGLELLGGQPLRGGSAGASTGPTSTLPPAKDPEVESAPPAGANKPRPFGRDLQHARQLGALNAVRGMVRHTIEQYAEFFGAFPQVVATGSDAAALFGDYADGLVETVVPDLELIGILEVCRAVEEMRASGFE